MTRVRGAALGLAALLIAQPALFAQRLVMFAPATERGLGAAGARVVPLAVSAPPQPETVSGARLFLGNFVGATLGSAAGWGAGILVADNGYRSTVASSPVSTTDEVIAGSIFAVFGAAAGSRLGATQAGGQGGSTGRRFLASGVGWAASLGVAAVAFGRLDTPHHAALISAVAVTHGLVTALLAPRL